MYLCMFWLRMKNILNFLPNLSFYLIWKCYPFHIFEHSFFSVMWNKCCVSLNYCLTTIFCEQLLIQIRHMLKRRWFLNWYYNICSISCLKQLLPFVYLYTAFCDDYVFSIFYTNNSHFSCFINKYYHILCILYGHIFINCITVMDSQFEVNFKVGLGKKRNYWGNLNMIFNLRKVPTFNWLL